MAQSGQIQIQNALSSLFDRNQSSEAPPRVSEPLAPQRLSLKFGFMGRMIGEALRSRVVDTVKNQKKNFFNS